jgi:hypothetical protein
MKTTSIRFLAVSVLALAGLSAAAAPKVPLKTWTDPAVALREDPDFALQGEYAGANAGAQVVALGEGRFDVYLLDGGLPGAGWEPGKTRTVLHGGKDGEDVALKDDAGKVAATLRKDRLIVVGADGAKTELARTERKSPTLDAKPPAGALALFDGTSADEWMNGKTENGLLLATSCTSKKRFADYTLHLEFRTPYMPAARGQQRGNSGVYHSGRWETQILDSFGLEGKDNECGGIYSVSKPRLNMCLPPLAWQTYDVEFTAAKFDATGKRVAWPSITVRLNGVVVHENLELPKDFTTAAPIGKPLDGPEGPVFLQDHGNPVVFRNIWIVPGK